jgi:hypothetical protein
VSGLLLIYIFYYLFGVSPDPTGRVDIFTDAAASTYRLPVDRFCARRRLRWLVGRV